MNHLEVMGGELATNDDPTTHPNTMTVQMTPEAEEVFYQLDERRVDLVRQGRTMWVRSAATAAKIAMLEAIALDPVNPIVDAEVLASASGWSTVHTLYAEEYLIKNIADTDHERRLNTVFGHIERAGATGISRNELVRRTQQMKTEDLDSILKQLEIAERITATTLAGPGPGRKPTVYRALIDMHKHQRRLALIRETRTIFVNSSIRQQGGMIAVME